MRLAGVVDSYPNHIPLIVDAFNVEIEPRVSPRRLHLRNRVNVTLKNMLNVILRD